MIPQRTTGVVLFGNGLKTRVTACRKRIRRGRVARRSDDDLLPEAAVVESSGRTFPSELSVVRQSCVEISEISDLKFEISDTEQEVGIT